MKRRRRPTPSDIEVRNYKKRTGLFQIWITSDLTHLAIQSRRKENAQSMIVMDQLKRCGFSIERSGTKSDGPFIAWLAIKGNTKAITEGLKLVAEPERCERCRGNGKIPNPNPAPNLPQLDWKAGETRDAFEVRLKRAQDDYCAKYGVSNTNWASITACPVCRGSGRTVAIEEEEAAS